MDKIATLVKEAEVRGVLAGLVDAGHLKVASYEELEALTCAVASCLPDQEYNLDDVLSKTAEVVEYLDSIDPEETLEKEAGEGEVDEVAAMAAIGELTLLKMAGEIDDATFEKEASRVKAIMDGAKAVAGKVKDAVVGKEITNINRTMKNFPDSMDADLAGQFKELKKMRNAAVAKRVGGAAAVAGSAVGGKALYDKYKK